MSNNFFPATVYSILAGIVTMLGSWLIIKNETTVKRYTNYLLAFAAGVMVSVVFTHLLPESVEVYSGSPETIFLWAFAGFGSFYILENFVMFHPCSDEACELHKIGIISFVGLFIHSLLDGVAIAVGFEVSGSIGILTALSVILHEFPEGISISGILLHAGHRTKNIFWLSFLVAVATPLGTLVFLPLSSYIPKELLACFLAFMSGSFLYLASADLLPEAHKKERHRAVVGAFLAGVLVVLVGGHFLEH